MQDDTQHVVTLNAAIIRKIVFSKLRGYVIWSHDSQGNVSYSLHGWGVDVTGIQQFFVMRHPFYLRNRYVLTGTGERSTFLIELSSREYRQLSRFVQVHVASQNTAYWLA